MVQNIERLIFWNCYSDYPLGRPHKFNFSHEVSVAEIMQDSNHLIFSVYACIRTITSGLFWAFIASNLNGCSEVILSLQFYSSWEL